MSEIAERVIDDDEHTNAEQEDIGDLTDLDGDGIPDDLDDDGLDDLLVDVDPDDIETLNDEEENDDGAQ